MDVQQQFQKHAQGSILEVLTNLHGTHVLATESGNVISLCEWLQATVSKSLSGVKLEIGQSSNNTGAFEELQMLGAVKQFLTHLSGNQLLRSFHVWAYCMSFSSIFQQKCFQQSSESLHVPECGC